MKKKTKRIIIATLPLVVILVFATGYHLGVYFGYSAGRSKIDDYEKLFPIDLPKLNYTTINFIENCTRDAPLVKTDKYVNISYHWDDHVFDFEDIIHDGQVDRKTIRGNNLTIINNEKFRLYLKISLVYDDDIYGIPEYLERDSFQIYTIKEGVVAYSYKHPDYVLDNTLVIDPLQNITFPVFVSMGPAVYGTFNFYSIWTFWCNFYLIHPESNTVYNITFEVDT